MKAKMSRIVLFAVSVVMLLILPTACSSKSERDESTSEAKYGATVTQETNMSFGSDQDGSVKDKGEAAATEETTAGGMATSGDTTVNPNEKIIRRAYMEVETQEFEALIESVNSEIKKLGGYVESSSINGRSYNYSYNLRNGNIVARVPKNQLDSFMNQISGISNVIRKEENTENVTLQYTDVESHKKALLIEQERLLVLLGKADKMEDIIALETRLSSIRYELESYEAQLRLYDNQVEYSTVTLNIQEVERMTDVPEDKKTVWDRIKTGFGDNLYNMGEGFKDFVVWFAVNILYIIIWVIVIAVIVIVIRKIFGKGKIENIAKHQDISQVQEENKEDKQ